MKVSKILPSYPSLNGILIHGQFYPSPKPTEVEVSVLSSSNQIIKLSHIANKSLIQIASDITQEEQKIHRPRSLSYIQLVGLSFHRFMTLVFPELTCHRPIPQSTSPYGAALIVPFGDESIDSLIYFKDHSSIAIQPPLTISVPNIVIHPRNISKNLTITVVLEKSIVSIHEGSSFVTELRKTFETLNSK